MGFGDAISAGFYKFVALSGRASRAEYWYWMLFSVLVILAFTFVDIVVFGVSTGPLSTLATPKLLIAKDGDKLPPAFASAATPKMTVQLPSSDGPAFEESVRRFLDQSTGVR